MKRCFKIMLVITGCIIAFLLYIQFTTGSISKHLSRTSARTDSGTIKRGKYLVLGLTLGIPYAGGR